MLPPPGNLGILIHAALLSVSDQIEFWIATRAALDAATVALLYRAGFALGGRAVAVAAAGLYTVAPLAWSVSRDPASSALPFLGAAALHFAVHALRQGGTHWLLGLAAATGLLARTDPAQLASFLPLVITLLVARPSAVPTALTSLIYGLLAAPAALRAIGTAAQAPDLWSMLRLLAGSAPEPALEMLATGLVALILAGSALAFIRGRAEHYQAVPALWLWLPLAVAATAGRLGADLLAGLLPSAVCLAALPLSASPSGRGIWLRRIAPLALAIEIGWSGLLTARLATADAAADPAAPPLRFWERLANEAIDASARVGATELIILPAAAPFERADRTLYSLVAPRLAVRQLEPAALALPLERDALYVLFPGSGQPPPLSRPSARFAAIEVPTGGGTARLLSLRPRPAEQWLAGDEASSVVRFQDGDVLVVRLARQDAPGSHTPVGAPSDPR